MDYDEAHKAYADAHNAGTLSDADYVEWLVSVRQTIMRGAASAAVHVGIRIGAKPSDASS